MCVTVINVGYGDAILFQLKNGYTALLDGGSAWSQNLKAILIAFGQQIILPDSRLSI